MKQLVRNLRSFRRGPLRLIGLFCWLAAHQAVAQGGRTQVYVGGGDSPPGAWDGYLGNPGGWTWVRDQADGYYLNVFPLNNNAGDANQNSTLSRMAGLFRNKNLFYETEAESYLHRVSDFDDKARIDILTANGFNVNYTTCNGEFTQSRIEALHWRKNRPIFALQGPWVVGGDINSSAAGAVSWRNLIDRTDGSATDGPLGLWDRNEGNMKGGSYSGVKYSHARGKQAMVMLCPYQSDGESNGAKSGSNFLRIGKDCVRGHEDNDAMPDIWVVSYYAAQLQQYPVTPEQVNGAAAPTVTGMAYYVLRHLRDPDNNARLSVPAQSGVSPIGSGATVQLSGSSKSFTVNLANSSSWLDLIPVLKGSVADPANAWNVSFQLGGQTVSASVLSAKGLVFYKDLRLNPGTTKALTVTIASKSGQPTTAPLTISLNLLAHPTESAIKQTFAVNVNAGATTTRSPYAGVIGLPGTVEAENFDKGGEGVAYHDSDATNLGGEYRPGEGVDIQSCTEGGYNVGWTAAGEWLEYSVNVASAGAYQVGARVASPNAGRLHYELDGQALGGSVALPPTGGYQTWQTVTSTVTLSAGAHVLRVAVEAGGVNLNRFVFTTTTTPGGAGLVSGQLYRLTARHSGQVLDLRQCAAADGARVQQYRWLDNACQRWRLEATDGGYYKLRSLSSGLVLEVNAAGLLDGDRVQQGTDNSGDWQQWKPEATDGGYYKLTNRHSGRVLEVGGISQEPEAGVQQWGYVGGGNQQWLLDPVGPAPAARTALATTTAANARTAGDETPSLQVFPNPASDQVTVTVPVLRGAARLTIHNALGQLVQERAVESAGSVELNTAGLAPGVYILSLHGNGLYLHQRLVLE